METKTTPEAQGLEAMAGDVTPSMTGASALPAADAAAMAFAGAPVPPQNDTLLPPTGLPIKRPKRTRKIIKAVIQSFVGLAIVGGLVWFTYQVFFAPPPEYYRTDYVRPYKYLSTYIYGDGYLNPSMSEDIYPMLEGEALMTYGYVGMPVREGDLLYEISPQKIDDAVTNLYKQIDSAQAAIAEQEGKIADINETISEVHGEQRDMQRAAVLYAPFSGRMVEVKPLIIGEKLQRGTEICRLIDDSKMKLVLYYSYGYEHDIYLGQSCSVSISSAMTEVSGQVTGIEKIRRIDSDGTVSFEVEITLSNPGTLASGVMATAAMYTKDGELILPIDNGRLAYNREEIITVESVGALKKYNARNYFEIRAGELLLELDFQIDNSEIEGYLLLIETHRETITAKELEIEELYLDIQEQEDSRQYLQVYAPISGNITQFDVYPGQVLGMNSIIRISQNSTLTMKASIDERYIRSLEVGMIVEVTVGGWDLRPGTITAIDMLNPNMDYGYTRYPATIVIDNSDGSIFDGQYAYFNYITAESHNTMVVPVNAVKNTYMGQCLFIRLSEDSEIADAQRAAAVEIKGDVIMPEGFVAIPVVCGITEGRLIEVWGEAEGSIRVNDEVFLSFSDVKTTPPPTPEPAESEEPGVEEPGIEDPGIGKPGIDDGWDDGGIIIDPGIDDGLIIDPGFDDGYVDDGMIIDPGFDDGYVDDGMVITPGTDDDWVDGGDAIEPGFDDGIAIEPDIDDGAVSKPGEVQVQPMPMPVPRPR